MRSIPQAFYHSPAWRAVRATYLQQHPLCEDCLAAGRYVPAEHVHHIVWLTPDNYTNPEISLNWKNLRAVCIDCHNRIHASRRRPRYKVDELGRVTPLPSADQ